MSIHASSVRVHKPHGVAHAVAVGREVRIFLIQRVDSVPHREFRVAATCAVVVEAGDVVELLARELEGVLVGGGVLVCQGLAVGGVALLEPEGLLLFPSSRKK